MSSGQEAIFGCFSQHESFVRRVEQALAAGTVRASDLTSALLDAIFGCRRINAEILAFFAKLGIVPSAEAIRAYFAQNSSDAPAFTGAAAKLLAETRSEQPRLSPAGLLRLVLPAEPAGMFKLEGGAEGWYASLAKEAAAEPAGFFTANQLWLAFATRRVTPELLRIFARAGVFPTAECLAGAFARTIDTLRLGAVAFELESVSMRGAVYTAIVRAWQQSRDCCSRPPLHVGLFVPMVFRALPQLPEKARAELRQWVAVDAATGEYRDDLLQQIDTGDARDLARVDWSPARPDMRLPDCRGFFFCLIVSSHNVVAAIKNALARGPLKSADIWTPAFLGVLTAAGKLTPEVLSAFAAQGVYMDEHCFHVYLATKNCSKSRVEIFRGCNLVPTGCEMPRGFDVDMAIRAPALRLIELFPALVAHNAAYPDFVVEWLFGHGFAELATRAREHNDAIAC